MKSSRSQVRNRTFAAHLDDGQLTPVGEVADVSRREVEVCPAPSMSSSAALMA